MAGTALLDHVSAIDDPRKPGKVFHLLPEVMPPPPRHYADHLITLA